MTSSLRPVENMRRAHIIAKAPAFVCGVGRRRFARSSAAGGGCRGQRGLTPPWPAGALWTHDFTFQTAKSFETVIASEAKQSMAAQRKSGLLRRGACHRARIRATRWLLGRKRDLVRLRHQAALAV